jgi:membrane dipeptidase
MGTVALPELRRGRVALCCATLLARSTGAPVTCLDYLSPAQARGSALGQLAYYRGLEQLAEVRVLSDAPGLAAHVAEWQAWEGSIATQAPCPPLGFVISMESADPILSPARLGDWWEAGVRVIGPAHYGSGRYAGGTGTEDGLTDLGVGLLREMDRLGVILDVTHFSDQAFWEALGVYGGPVLASHNNCRALVPHQRQFSDSQLRALFERNGVVGVAFDCWMLGLGFVKGKSSNEGVTLAHVVDHIDHICQLAGSAQHAGIGSDLDGLFGREQSPRDLDTIADVQRVGDLLAERGYSADDVAAVMHGNFVGLLCASWS